MSLNELRSRLAIFDKKKKIEEPASNRCRETLFHDEKPLSVAVIRRSYRQRQHESEANETELAQRHQVDIPPTVVRRPEDDSDDTFVLREEKIFVVRIIYASILRPLRRDEIVQTVEGELRRGRPVRLFASLKDNDNDASLCRLGLRTIHAALNPSLVDLIPPPPVRHHRAGHGLVVTPRRCLVKNCDP